MTYLEQLEALYQKQKAAGLVVDVKFSPMVSGASVEATSKVALEILTGQRAVEELDLTGL